MPVPGGMTQDSSRFPSYSLVRMVNRLLLLIISVIFHFILVDLSSSQVPNCRKENQRQRTNMVLSSPTMAATFPGSSHLFRSKRESVFPLKFSLLTLPFFTGHLFVKETSRFTFENILSKLYIWIIASLWCLCNCFFSWIFHKLVILILLSLSSTSSSLPNYL